MINTFDSAEVEKMAMRLAVENADAVTDIQEIWFFPNEQEIRLIEINSSIAPDEEISPFHFPAAPNDGYFLPIAVALINPESKTLPLPDSWGKWEDGKIVYKKVKKADDNLERSLP